MGSVSTPIRYLLKRKTGKTIGKIDRTNEPNQDYCQNINESYHVLNFINPLRKGESEHCVIDECSIVKMCAYISLLTSSPGNNQMKNYQKETKRLFSRKIPDVYFLYLLCNLSGMPQRFMQIIQNVFLHLRGSEV